MKHILPILLCTALAFGCQKKDINGNNPVKDDDAKASCASYAKGLAPPALCR
jgi:hypothetical protein